MTDDQFALLQDKVTLWRKASTEGQMELRDYNRRAGEALAAALVERAELLDVLKAAKRQMWIDASSTWTMSDFKNWALIQKIDAVLTLADGVAR